MGHLLAAALCALAQNPGWPPADPELAPEAFADPATWPGDPDFGPKVEGDACLGQLELYGYTPLCTPLIRESERDLGAGLAADQAWAITAGRPAVTLGLAGDGVDLAHPDLVARWALNGAELSFPDIGVPTSRHDVNRDGAFTVLDFTSATGTVPPTLDRVLDRRLIARPDRGDTNGNGLLDAQDILRIFSNGRDEDGNGYVDDIVGWDFLDDDNDPSAPIGASAGTREALAAVGTANNGVGGAGICPRCTAIPIRLSARGLAGADRGAFALLYASGRRARIILVTPALIGAGPHLTSALALTETRGSLVVAAAGTGSSQLARTAWPEGAVLVVGSVGHDRAARARATSQVAADPCARFGAPVHVVAPGGCDDRAAARVAGVAGLALSAARGEDPGLSPLDPGLRPGELWAVLQASAVDLGAPGWDLRTAHGRVHARRAVDLVAQRRVPPHGIIAAPSFGQVLDPSRGAPLTVRVQGSRSRHERVRWTVYSALGAEPSRDALEEIATGVFAAGEDRVAQVELPTEGLRPDPTAPLDSELTLQVTFHSEGASGATSVAHRVVHLHRDLEVMPAFPVALGAGNVGGVRAAALDAEGPEHILVGTTDGRIHALDARGQARLGFEPQSPPQAWIGLAGHPRLPEIIDGLVAPGLRAPILAPLSLAPVGGGEERLIVGVSVDGHLLAFGERGAVQAGFPVLLSEDLARPRAAPAGVTSAVALDARRAPAVLLSSDGRRALARVDAHGLPLDRLELEGVPGAPALARDGSVWVATTEQVFHFAPGANTPSAGWPAALQPRATARGLLAARLPAPALGEIEGRNFAFIAPWGGSVARLSPGEGLTPLDALAWHTAIAIADLDRDGSTELVVSVAPAPQLEGLRPAEAAGDVRAALDPLQGAVTTGFAGAAGGATGEPLIVDVGGDEAPEVVFGDDTGRLWAIGADGRVPPGFPKVTGDPLLGAPAVGDIDGDGRLELLAATRRGRIWAWRLRTSSARRVPWNGARGGPASLGDADAAERSAARDADGCRCVAADRPRPSPQALLLGALAAGLGRRRGRSPRAPREGGAGGS